MLALKRENDILMMENIRLKTLRRKLENEIKEIKETADALKRIERGIYETGFLEEDAQDGAQQENSAFEEAPTEEYDMLSFESVPDSFDGKGTNK